jgi:hypothetical protein
MGRVHARWQLLGIVSDDINPALAFLLRSGGRQPADAPNAS